MENINKTLLDKICGLLAFLTRSKAEFEMVADEIEDCNLKTALNGLSSESDQYATEITVHLQTLGINSFKTEVYQQECSEDSLPALERAEATNGNELLYICNNTENRITKAYNEILGSYFPFSSLKEIMACQLTSLQFAFIKIKTFNTVRFS